MLRTTLVFFPITHINFLLILVGPVKETLWVLDIGAIVVVPTWVAVTKQFPAFNRFKVEPLIEQVAGVEDE